MIRVTRQNPCPVCGKPDYCFITDDGTKAVCMRVPSEHPTKSPDCQGYVHILKDTPREARPMPVRPVRRPVPRVDPGAYMERLRKGGWSDGVSAWLAGKLGVSAASLDALAPAADFIAKAFAFPMRDGHGKVVGIRYRGAGLRPLRAIHSAVSDADDLAVQGLFYRADIQPCRVIAVCEGPTDTAAALTLGLSAVGRASCNGGEDMLNVLFTRLGVEECVIVADNDGEKLDAYGHRMEPGLNGALKLASRLCVPSRIIIPPCKDIRLWVRAGATLEAFDALVGSASWHTASVPRHHGVMRPMPTRRATVPAPAVNPLALDSENIEDTADAVDAGDTRHAVPATIPEKKPVDRAAISAMWRKAVAAKRQSSAQPATVDMPLPELTPEERATLDAVLEATGGTVITSADPATVAVLEELERQE